MILKKSLIILFVLLSFSVVAQEDTYQNHIKKAMEQYRFKKYDASTKTFSKAFRIKHNNDIDLYNAACSASLANRYKLAFKWLNMAIDFGYSDAHHLQEDIDFLPLRSKEGWQEIVKKIKQQDLFTKKTTAFGGDDISWLFDQKITNIYAQCSDSLKIKISKKELGKTIRDIRAFFKQHHITNADGLKKITRGTSTNHLYINGKKTETFERKIVPSVINGLPGAFLQDTAYKLTISYIIKEGENLFDKIQFKKPYFDKKYLTNSSFLKEALTMAYTIDLYTYYNENKYNLKKDLWNNSFSKPVMAIAELPFVKSKKVQFTTSDKPYYLILLADQRQRKTVTIIFSDNSKYILISDGHKMGFVQDKKAKVRKVLKKMY